MIKPILVITSKYDVHADFVAMEIRSMGGDIVRINTEDMVFNSIFHIEKIESSLPWQLHLHLKDSGKTINQNSFDTIWYRKPSQVEVDNSVQEDHAQAFIKEEYHYYLRSFYTLYSEKRWINPFWSLRHASQKLPNLELALELGLKIPKTLITNNPEKAKEFGESLNWNLLVKTFYFSGFVVNQTEAWHCTRRKNRPRI